MRMRGGFAGCLLVAAVLAGAGSALGSTGYKSPVRLKQLARLDTQVDFVRNQRWPKRVSVAHRGGLRAIIVARSASLPEVARAAPGVVREDRHHVWELRVPLFVVQGATLTISEPAVAELRLIAHRRDYATIVAYNSNVRIHGTGAHSLVVRSWDSRRARPDLNLDDGRGSVSVRGKGRLYASHASFSYLGFTSGRASGVSVNGFGREMKGSGRVDHSTFSHNVFGAYTWEAEGMRWTRNRFTHNQVYGFDPHDGSDWFVVAHNYAAENGRHGIIFSRRCKHDVIRDNISTRNGWHGIVIDAGRAGKTAPSAYDTVEGNVVRANHKVGISIGGSDHTVVRNNRVRGGLIGIRIFGRPSGEARGNRIDGNTTVNTQEIGILVQDPARATRISGDTTIGGAVGIVVRRASETAILGSVVRDVDQHAVAVVGATSTRIAYNHFSGSGPSAIRTSGDTATNMIRNNSSWNYPLVHDLARVLGWFVAPGLWTVLFVLVLFSPLIRRRRQKPLPGLRPARTGEDLAEAQRPLTLE